MKVFHFTWFSALALGCMSGCGPDTSFHRQPVSLPADWKQAGAFPVASPSRDLATWWGRFHDSTLSRLIDDGLRCSPDIAAATARVKEATARRKAIAADLFPSLSGSAARSSESVTREGIGNNKEISYSAGLNASWEIDVFGKTRSSIAAASAELGATEEHFHSVQASLASEIAMAYTSLRASEARLVVLRDSVRSREETARLASWRQQAGEADSLESNQALSSLEQARAAIPALEQVAAKARNLLALLCGREPGAVDGTLSAGKHAIPEPAANLAVGIPADTIRKRPDVRVAGYQWLGSIANVRTAKADLLPSLKLSGSLGMNALSSGKIFNPETTSANIIAGLTGPIFDAGRIRANIAAQSAVEEQAFQNYRGAILTALSEVEDALIACRRSAERLATLETATVAAREAARLAQQRYQAGVIDLLTVLDAQRTLLGLEDSLLSARTDRTVAHIQLYKALGGGWS